MPMIDQALDALLVQVIEHDTKRTIVPLPCGRTGYDIEAFARDPVGMSLRLALHHLGMLAWHAHGTARELSVIAARVASMGNGDTKRRSAILTEAWREFEAAQDFAAAQDATSLGTA